MFFNGLQNLCGRALVTRDPYPRIDCLEIKGRSIQKIRRSLCTLENPLWFSHRRASLAKKQHEGRMLALIVRE